MIEISENVIYVRGARKGAIYNFNDQNLYWINSESCELIQKLVAIGKCHFTVEEEEYLLTLEKMGLYDPRFKPKEFQIESCKEKRLELAWLEITQACNCRCLHCYQGEYHFKNTDCLELNNWIDIINQLNELNVSRVVVIGGEPCVHKDICAILEELASKGIMTTLFTNATLIDDNLFDIILANKRYIQLKVSLYGQTEEIHDKITQVKGSFNRLISNVKKLTINGVRVDIAVVVMRENEEFIEGIESFIESLGAHYSKFDVIRNVFGGTQNQHTPTNQNIINSVKFVCPKFKADKKRFLNNVSCNSCWYGKIAITDSGQVLPCVFERDIFYGNVKDQSLRDIIHSSTAEKFWSMSFDFIDGCKDCEFRYACKDCRPLGKSVSGNLYHKNPRCCYNPYEGEWRSNI